MFNKIVTTMNSYEEDVYQDGILQPGKMKGSLKEYQTVIAVGDTVRGIKEGDIVAINPTRYAVMKHEDKSLKNGVIGDNMVIGYKFDTVNIDDKECLMLYDQDISFVVLESEEVPSSRVILPDKPEIVIN